MISVTFTITSSVTSVTASGTDRELYTRPAHAPKLQAEIPAKIDLTQSSKETYSCTLILSLKETPQACRTKGGKGYRRGMPKRAPCRLQKSPTVE